jgi:leucyl/phenylalanyl-tRNA--protein transferase
VSLWLLDNDLWFPDPEDALPDGLLAVGGDLRPERLLLAYHQGIFPWYSEGDPFLWWSPDPRFVLFPEKLRVSHSMRPLLNKPAFEFRRDSNFKAVMQACASTPRGDENGTWIDEEIIEAYTELHDLGYAHSAEAWENGELVGGLYGVRIGKMFFGESMFSRRSNASKFAFIRLVQELKQEGIKLIDCQMHTEHLERFGAELVTRKQFLELLHTAISGLPGL